ncbi:MAG: RluA family pseudouridine synthase [Chthoniobacteraceae bacterium]|nr:RluA family pseudouridine synthase [Chthoniobacteraceae bacterium]
MPEYPVPPEASGQRLDHYLSALLAHLSRSRIQALIKEGHIRVGGAVVKPGEKLRGGQEISVHEPEAVPVSGVEAEEIPLDILFEDADLLVLNKAPGMVVHPAAGNPGGTLVNALLHHCGSLSAIGGEQRPGIVHRLDKETSGCIVVAKNDAAHQSLARQFAGRTVLKVYLALAAGRLRSQSGVINAPIGRHPVHRKKMAVAPEGKGRNAVTDYKVLRELPGASLVQCTLHTGRTHQIRVHLHHLGHPLLGDALYGRRAGYPRQMLHAWRLGFTHPRTGQWMEFQSPIPPDFVTAGAVP